MSEHTAEGDATMVASDTDPFEAYEVGVRKGWALAEAHHGWRNSEQSSVMTTEVCSTCGGAFDSPPCSVDRQIGWSGHTRAGGAVANARVFPPAKTEDAE